MISASSVTISMFFLFTIKRDVSRRGGLLHCNMVQAASWSHGVGVIKGEIEASLPFSCAYE